VGLIAIGNYSDGASAVLAGVSWAVSSSSPANAVSVSGSGVVTCNNALATAGSGTISATSGGVVGYATVNCQAPVLKSIAITPSRPGEINYGGTLQLTATATYATGAVQNVTSSSTWSSSATSAATVSSTGLVKCQQFRSRYDESAKISATIGATTGSVTVTCEQPGGDGDKD